MGVICNIKESSRHKSGVVEEHVRSKRKVIVKPTVLLLFTSEL